MCFFLLRIFSTSFFFFLFLFLPSFSFLFFSPFFSAFLLFFLPLLFPIYFPRHPFLCVFLPTSSQNFISFLALIFPPFFLLVFFVAHQFYCCFFLSSKARFVVVTMKSGWELKGGGEAQAHGAALWLNPCKQMSICKEGFTKTIVSDIKENKGNQE